MYAPNNDKTWYLLLFVMFVSDLSYSIVSSQPHFDTCTKHRDLYTLVHQEVQVRFQNIQYMSRYAILSYVRIV